jgi:hypothetical protein
MAEDIYFDASHKFREPRKFKKSQYKHKGKEYKYIDPAESLIQQVETKIVKPKRMKKVKKEIEPLEKRLTHILESRRKFRKGREVSQSVDPEELLRIKALQERAIVPSTKIEMERQKEEKEKEAKTLKEANEQVQKLLEEGRHNELIQGLKRVAEKPSALPFIPNLLSTADIDESQRTLNAINSAVPFGKTRKDFNDYINSREPNILTKYGSPDELFKIDKRQVGTDATGRPLMEADDTYVKRVRDATKVYNRYRDASGRGLFGGSLQNVHPMLAGALIAHDAIHRSANRVIASLPAKHKGIKELEKLKKMAKRSVLAINKKYGGSFFSSMLNKGKSLLNFASSIPSKVAPVISKGIEMAKPLVREHAGTAVKTAVSALPIPFAGFAGDAAKKGVDFLTNKFIKDKPKQPYNPYALI